MAIRIAVNGFGRIGRNVVRGLFEYQRQNEFELVAINDLGAIDVSAHLLEYDTVHGHFGRSVAVEGDKLVIDGHPVQYVSQKDPSQLPWKALNVDVVLECTGIFTSKAKAGAHLAAGAHKVVISAPGGEDVDATVVYGVNHQVLRPDFQVISNASCTTNCLAPLAKVLNDSIGIENGLMTTVHSYTNDQVLTDVYHSDVRRARSATQSMIPTKTGAAAAIGLVLPALAGRLDGLAVRVPTINVSLVDFTFTASRDTSVAEVNDVVRKGMAQMPACVLRYNDKPLVSVDFNHNLASCNFDSTQTRLSSPRLVKVMAWYDNEWGYANRMLDTTSAWMQA